MSNTGTRLRDGIRPIKRLRARWVVMLLLTAVATMASLLSTPFSAEEGEFFHALRSGEITSVAVGHSSDFAEASGFHLTQFNNGDDIAVSWLNRYGFRRETVLRDLQGLAPVTDTGTDTGTGTGATTSTPAVDPAASIVKTAKTLGTAAPTIVQPGDLPFDHLNWLSILATILMVGVVIRGPQPRRMTKWAAFWACFFPFNVGIFYMLLRDSPWNARMNLLPEPRPGVTGVLVDPATNERISRHGGWAMFIGFGLLINLAFSLLLIGVSWFFPTYLDPVGWSAVSLAGTPITR